MQELGAAGDEDQGEVDGVEAGLGEAGAEVLELGEEAASYSADA